MTTQTRMAAVAFATAASLAGSAGMARAAVKSAVPAMPGGWADRRLQTETGDWWVGLSLEHENYITAIKVDQITSNLDNERTGFSTYAIGLGFRYFPGFSLDLTVPYRHVISPLQPAGKTNAAYFVRDRQGVGDIIVMNWFDLAWQEAATPLGVGLGLRLPTGEADPDHVWNAAAGNSHDPVLQPGAGTTDPIASAYYIDRFGPLRVFGNGTYRVSGGFNAYGYRYSNELQVLAGAHYELRPGLSGSLQARWLNTGNDLDYGSLQKSPGPVTDTGGDWIWVSPGASLRLGDATYFVRFDLPVWRMVSGSQFISDFRVQTGAFYRWTPGNPPPASGTSSDSVPADWRGN